MPTSSLADLVTFCYLRKAGTVFEKWTELELSNHIYDAYKKRLLGVVYNPDGTLAGIGTAQREGEDTLYIVLLMGDKRVLGDLLGLVEAIYPEVKYIEGVRKKKKFVKHEISKLKEKLNYGRRSTTTTNQ